MDVRRGEERSCLLDEVLHEGEGFILSRTQDVGKNTLTLGDGEWPASTAEVWIGSKGCGEVARHVDLRDDHDMAVLCIRYQVPNL